MKKTDKIRQKIKQIKIQNKPNKQKSFATQFFDVAATLVAGMIVGVLFGLMFDNLFDSKPLFLIICIILSNIASFRSIWKQHIKS